MIEVLLFLNGILFAAVCLVTYSFTQVSNKVDDQKMAITEELKKLLSDIAETHNTLTTSVAASDEKLANLSLRFDMITEGARKRM